MNPKKSGKPLSKKLTGLPDFFKFGEFSVNFFLNPAF